MQIQPSKIGKAAQYFVLLALLTGLSSPAWAGPDPVCGDGLCNKGEKSDSSCPMDCRTEAPGTSGSVFNAEITGMMTGSIYTRPDQNVQADPKNIVFQPNRGNEVMMEVDTTYLVDEFGKDRVKACFPAADNGSGGLNRFIAYEGSLHLNDYFKQRADLAAYFWFWVGDIQYVFEFRDDGGGWYDDDGNAAEFPPSYGETIHRDAWIWLLRVTTRNAENPCVTDGNIMAGTASDPIVTFDLSLVDACEYPYDGVYCSAF